MGALDALGLPFCLGGLHRRSAGGVEGRHKDGSERNAGLAGFSGLNTSGSGEVGP